MYFVLAAVNQHVPSLDASQDLHGEVVKLVRKRKSCGSIQRPMPLELTTKFKILRKQTKGLISFKYSQYLKSMSGKLKTNPRSIWSFHSLKSKSRDCQK